MIEVQERLEFPLVVDGQNCLATELYTEAEIYEGISRVGAELASKYLALDIGSIIMVPVLQGAIQYTLPLRGAIEAAGGPRIRMDGIRASSMNKTHSTGKATLTRESTQSLTGEHLLVTDDIFDRGVTMEAVYSELMKHKPASVWFTALIDKPNEKRIPGVAERIGGVVSAFTTKRPYYLIGWGLDYENAYRDLKSIMRIRFPLPEGGHEA